MVINRKYMNGAADQSESSIPKSRVINDSTSASVGSLFRLYMCVSVQGAESVSLYHSHVLR